MHYGHIIRKLREEAGMSQLELAIAIQRCVASVSFYERGLRDIPVSVLLRIATVLHVSPRVFFLDVEEAIDGSYP